MGIMSFDSKDFDRPKIVEEPDPANPGNVIQKNNLLHDIGR